ncbi:2-C-methyl-D-erythritol 4-phosphate cytidylyltransferase [Histidinibacterium lentulum]|uniref:2-C-methyl-D-erythritol 4-phosphate cytidylyltransferase n=2 Tax=Histidinibacterium lentulum TaxID=2480588 RepID=A0A3N2QV40_9RHOB|nr:2-C-methyl-D-erythritol 4-phosphate cytidylyltransferase [Histidinibacterium lentulum]
MSQLRQPVGVAALIVAAGRGTRMGGAIPKQYAPLNGACALRRSVEAFLRIRRIDAVRVVIHPADRPLYDEALAGLRDPRVLPPQDGGSSRAHSVHLGLESLAPAQPDRVLIHDAARPFVPAAVIDGVIDALDRCEGACAALPLVDALWQTENGHATTSVPREGLWRAQTPQGFAFRRLLDAHRRGDGSAADDVAVARADGMGVMLVEGAECNYKITTAADYARALAETAAQGRSPLRLVEEGGRG